MLLPFATLLMGPLAYLDPGTGSYFLQLIIAGLLGLLFVLKTYWRRIKVFLGRLFVSKVPSVREQD